MDRKDQGFSLVEMLISMGLLLFLLAVLGALLTPMQRRAKIEAGVTQSQMEGIVGLELLRTDIVHAGHGLPWLLPAGLTAYSENGSLLLPDNYPDAPRGIDVIDSGGTGGSDYLVLKSSNVGVETATQKVSFIQQGDASPHTWGDSSRDLAGTNRVVQIRLVDPDTGTPMILIPNGAAFFQTYGSVTAPPPTGFASEVWYVYGLTDNTDPVVPFNRADFFLSATNVPGRCAQGTSVLVKAVANQAAGGALAGNYSLCDCVADFQVAFGVDTDATPDGRVDCYTNDLANVLAAGNLAANVIAQTIRNRVREVRIYVLAQEGDRDMYAQPNAPGSMLVGETNPLGGGCVAADDTLGETFNIGTIANSAFYRWRVNRIVVQPENLTFSLVGQAKGAT